VVTVCYIFLVSLKVKYDLTNQLGFDDKETIHCEFDVSNSGIKWIAGMYFVRAQKYYCPAVLLCKCFIYFGVKPLRIDFMFTCMGVLPICTETSDLNVIFIFSGLTGIPYDASLMLILKCKFVNKFHWCGIGK
jgi:hypothetical protein